MTDNRENLLDKIRALLSKTVERGCTEEEHLAALAKARAMRDAYEITDEELHLTEKESAIFRQEPPGTKDPNKIKNFLVEAVAQFTDTRAWRNKDRTLTFCGLPSDVRHATWLLDHLAHSVQAELAEYLMKHDLVADRRRAINGFVVGICGRISARLRDLCKPDAAVKPTANNTALVVVKQAAIQAKMEECGIHLRSTTSRLVFDDGAVSAGHSAGDRASFGRPVSGKSGVIRIGSK
jgi:hypothetical protein